MMAVKLLPRIRVNYGLLDLLKACFVNNSSHKIRNKCKMMLAEFYNNENVLLVPSSRDAIFELLIRLPQKKVVIPSYTCMVVNEAVMLSGKEVVFAKSDMDTFNSTYLDYIDSYSIVLATHQYGLPCNIKEIAEKCKEVGAVLIEDCATSMGTKVDGKMTGTFGDYAVVSFNQSKTLNVPPFGGVLIGQNADMLEQIEETSEWYDGGMGFKIKGLKKGLAFVIAKNCYAYKLMHWLTLGRNGKLQRNEHEKTSKMKTDFYKIRFTEWQASILLRQLEKLEDIFKKRKDVYSYYNKHIMNPLLTLPVYYENAVCTRYAVLTEKRETFYEICLSKGVDMDFSHKSIGCPDDFKKEHSLADRIINLPLYYEMSELEMKRVVEVVNSIR